MIPLYESSSSILEIHSFTLFRTVGIADILLEIFSLSKCTFSEAFCSSSIGVVPSLSLSVEYSNVQRLNHNMKLHFKVLIRQTLYFFWEQTTVIHIFFSFAKEQKNKQINKKAPFLQLKNSPWVIPTA